MIDDEITKNLLNKASSGNQRFIMKDFIELEKRPELIPLMPIEIQESFFELQKMMQVFSKKLTGLNNRLTKRHQESKTFFIPFFWETDISDLDYMFSGTEKTAIEVYSSYFEDRENLNHLIKWWKNNDFFPDRIRILSKAIDAHYRKDFEISIPIFLIHIDGILRDKLGVNKHHQYANKLNRVNNSIFDETSQFIEILSKQVFQSTKHSNDSKEWEYPNRHLILHGIDLNYFEDSFASVRCILMLDILTRPDLSIDFRDQSDLS